ncbi:MAG: hypothetical protein PSN46_05215 [Gammaproteobacteria bacterium]|nr:hypothetical protein [Gammaproteobacteria bacterium]
MQAIDTFENRCVDYQDQHRITPQSTALSVYLHSHNVVYTEVEYMMPEHPPTVEVLSIIVKDVCRGETPYAYVFEQISARYLALVGDVGISSKIIFYYVSNVIISLLVLSRRNSQLSSEILIKIIQRFNFRDAVLRAGIEVIAEEVLRRCFLSINASHTRGLL